MFIVDSDGKSAKHRQIYLDYQASTPVDPRVLDAMGPYFRDYYANPHATTHRHALETARAVERARLEIADVLGVAPTEIIFSSGATESNNLAILGIAKDSSKQRNTLITQATEHQSVLEPIRSLKSKGFNVKVIGVHGTGIIDLDQLERTIDNRTLLVSVMLVNNETGVIQPIEEVVQICRKFGVLLHCDCAQVLGRVNLDLSLLGIDLATFSGHKIYGPKGVGALFVRSKVRRQLKPLFFGGGQQGGLRPGTLPVPLCVGFGCAATIASQERNSYVTEANKKIQRIKIAFEQSGLNVRFNGFHEHTSPGCLNISIPGIRAESLLERWNGLELSTGSACEAHKSRTSHVLRSMNISRSIAECTLRLSVGRFTTNQDISEIVSMISETSEMLQGNNYRGLEKMV